MKWLVLSCVLFACSSSNSVTCEDGRTCPADTVCDDMHALCVTPEQATVCVGKPDAEVCTAGSIEGHCLDGVCLDQVCGDGVVEFGEMCDDHNTISEDDCAADCSSNYKCGNTVIDPSRDEQCDDGGFLDHDGCSSSCLTEAPHWIEHTLDPGPRTTTAYAYDSRRGRFVVYGGSTGSVLLNETIEWNGADWVRISTPTLPTPRYTTTMAYDAERGVSVMFGGFDGTWDLSDTWTWDGARWSALNVGGPKERYGHLMVYDPRRKVIVLFGGFNDYVAQINDTWEWDGVKWTETTGNSTPPPRREFAAAVYDPKAGAIVMVGGSAGGSAALADTWTYDGQWHNVTPAGPHPAVRSAMIAYDTVSQRVILYGGYVLPSLATQSTAWAWNGTSWTNLGAAAPGIRASGAMASTGSQIVLFGGNTTSGGAALADTWTFGTAWAQPANMLPRFGHAAVTDHANARAVLYGGSIGGINVQGDTWQFTSSGFSLKAGAPPTARAYHSLAWDTANSRAVMFGGTTMAVGSAASQEAWIYDGTSWMQRTAGTRPPARYEGSMTFDGTKVILFGGESSYGGPSPVVYDDTWSFDGSLWTNVLPSVKPTTRKGASIAYDPILKQVVLFGGYGVIGGGNTQSADLDDTWVFDGTTWRDATSAFRPNKRETGTLTWNPARKRLLLTGGSPAQESYEWDGTTWIPVPATDLPGAGRIASAAFTSLDGTGLTMFGGQNATGGPSTTSERWELRWDSNATVSERCDGSDLDKDGLIGCADPDCWPVCTPLCMPGTTCMVTGPTCGDSSCQAPRETCRNCAADCGACPAVCGNYVCDMGEANCPGDCP